jgi:hypothetical protein
MCDACSHRPVCHPIVLSVRGRSHLSSSRDSRQTPPTLLCSGRAPLLPHLRTPLLQALTTLHHSHVPLSHTEPAAKPPSATRNHRSTESATSYGCHGHLPIERHLRPPTCSSITTATSARAHRRSTILEPALPTSSPASRHWFPTTNLHRPCEPTTVSPSTAYAPNRDPHLRGELPGTSFPGHSSPVSRNQPASRPPVKSGGAPLFRTSGPKGPSGPSRFRRLGQAPPRA